MPHQFATSSRNLRLTYGSAVLRVPARKIKRATGNSLICRMLNDTRSRSPFFQFLLLFGIAFGLWWIVDNTITNSGAQNKSVGFGFRSKLRVSRLIHVVVPGFLMSGAPTYLDVYYRDRQHLCGGLFWGFAATFLGFALELCSPKFLRIFATSQSWSVRSAAAVVLLVAAVLRACRTSAARLKSSSM